MARKRRGKKTNKKAAAKRSSERSRNGRERSSNKGRSRSDKPDLTTRESEGANALTVGLILATLATLFAEVIAFLGKLALVTEPAWRDLEWLQALPRLMIIVATITGLVCLVLNPIVARVRVVKLPVLVIAAIYLIGITPLLTLVAML